MGIKLLHNLLSLTISRSLSRQVLLATLELFKAIMRNDSKIAAEFSELEIEQLL